MLTDGVSRQSITRVKVYVHSSWLSQLGGCLNAANNCLLLTLNQLQTVYKAKMLLLSVLFPNVDVCGILIPVYQFKVIRAISE